MSTFLVGLGVIVGVIVCVVWLALHDPEQRATARRPSRRARRLKPARAAQPARRAPTDISTPTAPRPVASSRTPVSPFPHHTLRTGADLPPRSAPERRTTTRPKPARPAPNRDLVIDAPVGRFRASLALTVLVTFVGLMVALTIAGGILFVAEGLRNTVR